VAAAPGYFEELAGQGEEDHGLTVLCVNGEVCAMAVPTSGEPWWSATTLVVLYSSRRTGGHLGAGKFGGKVMRGWSSPGRGKRW
jgi:hypothetical protein